MVSGQWSVDNYCLLITDHLSLTTEKYMPVDVKMPQLGESVTEGTIGRWLKQVGDPIAEYEPLLEVTTDKVDTEVPATVGGTVLELLVPEGETVRVGTVIARLATDGEAATNGSAAPPRAATVATVEAPSGTTSTRAPSGSSAPISPVVARLAAEHNLNLADITGTGQGGRVTKKDVEAYLAKRGEVSAASTAPGPGITEPPTTMIDRDVDLQPEDVVDPQNVPHAPLETPPVAAPQAAPPIRMPALPPEGTAVAPLLTPPPAAANTPIPGIQAATPPLGPDDELLPLTGMRRAIAQHMVHSKRTAPHVTTVMEADLSRITAHRARHKQDFERQGVNLTFTAYFVEAAVRALREVPLVNASFTEGGIVQHHRVNVGVAVAIPDGLIVPVIKDADDKSLLGLARAVNDLAERARSRRLQPDDTQGGTFTITNHGTGGSIFAMPIINQPQAAILGVGAIQKRPVVITEGGLDAIAIRPMCYLSLTIDHRLLDGAMADAFLTVIKRTLEEYSG